MQLVWIHQELLWSDQIPYARGLLERSPAEGQKGVDGDQGLPWLLPNPLALLSWMLPAQLPAAFASGLPESKPDQPGHKGHVLQQHAYSRSRSNGKR